jgi:hypothetical protein
MKNTWVLVTTLLAAPAAVSAAWVTKATVDPLTRERHVSTSVMSAEGAWLTVSDRGVYVQMPEFLTVEGSAEVKYRFDDGELVELNLGVPSGVPCTYDVETRVTQINVLYRGGPDHMLWVQGPASTFLDSLRVARRLMFRAFDYNGKAYTYTFIVSGFVDPVKP